MNFSRGGFDPLKHFSRVLMQQGAVQLDADWNEQAAILLHHVRRLAANLFPDGGGGHGFTITTLNTASASCDDFAIGAGEFWVDGILCELEMTPVDVVALDAANSQIVVAACTVDNLPFAVGQYVLVTGEGSVSSGAIEVTGRIRSSTSRTRTLTLDADFSPLLKATNLRARRLVTYQTQPAGLPRSQRLAAGKRYQIYLDVWERLVTVLDDGSIREVALGGPDTATRTQVVWQIGALEFPPLATKNAGGRKIPAPRPGMTAQALTNALCRPGAAHHYAPLAVATVSACAAPALEACVPRQPLRRE